MPLQRLAAPLHEDRGGQAPGHQPLLTLKSQMGHRTMVSGQAQQSSLRRSKIFRKVKKVHHTSRLNSWPLKW